jgi:hypothetical protein
LDHGARVDLDGPRTDALEEPLGGEADRALDDVLHRTVRHQVELLEVELLHGDAADGAQHALADAVAGAMEELLHAPQDAVSEQRLAHPGQQQHLEVHDAVELARHLPQQLTGDDVGRSRGLADRHGDVAGGLAVTDHQDTFVACLLRVVQICARDEPTAGFQEVVQPVVGWHERRTKDAVGDDQTVDDFRRRAAI